MPATRSGRPVAAARRVIGIELVFDAMIAPSQDYPGNTGAHWFQQVVGSTSGGRTVSIWVFAGRPHPTAAQVARAQHLIDTLWIPRWPPPGG